MLKRKATNFMKNWINTKDKKCLVVQGARQTGKTYTVERFAEENWLKLILNRCLLRWRYFLEILP